MSAKAISINRAPVLTLWAAVVAERLGFDRNEALTLGKAVAGAGPAAGEGEDVIVDDHINQPGTVDVPRAAASSDSTDGRSSGYWLT